MRGLLGSVRGLLDVSERTVSGSLRGLLGVTDP